MYKTFVNLLGVDVMIYQIYVRDSVKLLEVQCTGQNDYPYVYMFTIRNTCNIGRPGVPEYVQ